MTPTMVVPVLVVLGAFIPFDSRIAFLMLNWKKW